MKVNKYSRMTRVKNSFSGNITHKFNEDEDEDVVDYIRLNEFIEGFDRMTDVT